MGASYSAMDYLGFPVLIFLFGFFLVLLLSISLIFRRVKKYQNPGAAFLPFFGAMGLIILLIGLLIPVFSRVGDLLIPGEYVMGTTAGEIAQILPGPMGAYHYRSGYILPGRLVIVEGEEYYVIRDDQLREGMSVGISYAHSKNGNVIFSWWESTPEEASRIQNKFPEPEVPKKPPKVVSPEQKILGVWLRRIGLAGFLGCLGLTALFQEKITLYVHLKDARIRDGIRFNPRCLIPVLLPLVFLCMLMIGSMVGSRENHALMIPVLGLGGMAGFVAVEGSTGLKLEGQTLTIRRLGKKYSYSWSDVRAVFWQRHRGLIGRSLVLVMHDGKSYWFNMETCLGVQHVYAVLCRYLEEAE